jgi:hypothetical protein
MINVKKKIIYDLIYFNFVLISSCDVHKLINYIIFIKINYKILTNGANELYDF